MPILTAFSLRHAILRSAEFMAQTPRPLKTKKKPCKIKVVAMHKMARNLGTSAKGILVDPPHPQAKELHQEAGDAEPRSPDSLAAEPSLESKSTRPDPTRYGDWELKGRCIDF